MRRQSLFLLVSLALVLSLFSCQKEEDKITVQSLTEMKNAIDGFDMSILLESDIEAVRSLAKATVVVPASLPVGVSGISINPTDPALSPGSTTVTITATGTYTTPIPVRAYNYLNSSEVIFTGSVPGNGSTGGSAAFVIPDYQDPGDGRDRYIMVEYQNSGWNYLVVYIQEPSKTTIQFQSNIVGDIPAAGNIYTITQLGDYPSVLPEMASFRAIDASNTTISNNVLIIPPSKTTNIEIYPNTGTTNRTVYLQYSIDNGVTWVTFESHTQLADNGGTGIINITYAYFTPNSANAEGSDIIVVLAGDFTNEVKVRATTSNKTAEGVVRRGVIYQDILNHGHQHDGGGTISIPDIGINGWHQSYKMDLTAYNGSTGLHWDVEYYDGQNWIPILLRNESRSTVQQPTYFMKLTNPNATTYKAERTNGNWPIKLKGYWRSNEVLISVGDAYNTTMMSNLIAPSNPGTLGGVGTDIDFIIPLHNNTTGRERILYLWYSVDYGTTWARWDKHTMPCLNWVGESTLIQK